MKKLIILSIFLTGLLTNAQADKTANAFSLSYANEINKEYNKAITNLIDLKENIYVVNFRLGWLYYINGEYNKSKAYYKKAIANETESVEARFGLIYPIIAMQNQDEVIAIYKQILNIDPNNATANYQLSNIYYLRKDWLNAEKYLETNVKLNPFAYYSNL
jgi:tetratricopeptide (TPR) repeat protein